MTPPPFRRKRPRREVDFAEFLAFMRRIIRKAGVRAAGGDPEGLAELSAIAGELEAATRVAVAGLRAEGFSWADIGTACGVSKQAAAQRWGRRGDD